MSARPLLPLLRRFGFLALPAIGIVELLLHVVQTTRKVPDGDWEKARQAVAAAAAPDDLVVFAPGWADPLGREHFKDALASIEREARPDDTRFARAFEVSILGGHTPELKDWAREKQESFGAVTVTTLRNPAPVRIIDDLVSRIAPDRAQVSIVEADHETPCAWMHGGTQTGPLGFGPALPADRFVCGRGGFVATSVMQGTDYRPHRCVYAPPLGGSAVLRIRFLNVPFGKLLHGHHGINWDSARFDSPPVALDWKVAGRTLARLVDRDEDGWKSFEIDTSELAGQTGELIAEVSATSNRNRMYCFEADTR